MDQQPEFLPRIGTFLVLVGIGLLLVFIGSGMAKAPHYGYLFGSLIVLVFGFLLRRRAKPRPSSGRLRVVRGIYDKNKERQEQKKQKK
jgi:sugar phosphate permease